MTTPNPDPWEPREAEADPVVKGGAAPAADDDGKR
jgi:hypothetical protein